MNPCQHLQLTVFSPHFLNDLMFFVTDKLLHVKVHTCRLPHMLRHAPDLSPAHSFFPHFSNLLFLTHARKVVGNENSRLAFPSPRWHKRSNLKDVSPPRNVPFSPLSLYSLHAPPTGFFLAFTPLPKCFWHCLPPGTQRERDRVHILLQVLKRLWHLFLFLVSTL